LTSKAYGIEGVDAGNVIVVGGGVTIEDLVNLESERRVDESEGCTDEEGAGGGINPRNGFDVGGAAECSS
jgi:hypothetical protein